MLPHIKPGDDLIVPIANGEPVTLLDTLEEHFSELDGVRIHHGAVLVCVAMASVLPVAGKVTERRQLAVPVDNRLGAGQPRPVDHLSVHADRCSMDPAAASITPRRMLQRS